MDLQQQFNIFRNVLKHNIPLLYYVILLSLHFYYLQRRKFSTTSGRKLKGTQAKSLYVLIIISCSIKYMSLFKIYEGAQMQEEDGTASPSFLSEWRKWTDTSCIATSFFHVPLETLACCQFNCNYLAFKNTASSFSCVSFRWYTKNNNAVLLIHDREAILRAKRFLFPLFLPLVTTGLRQRFFKLCMYFLYLFRRCVAIKAFNSTTSATWR